MHQDLQLVAEKCILLGLKLAGIVDGNVEEMVDQRIGALFMPHGKGWFCPHPPSFEIASMQS